MCKLIEDPKEILPLMPTLKPLVTDAFENISDPEAKIKLVVEHSLL